MLLNRQQVKEVDDLPTKIVAMPEWGGDIKIKTLSASKRVAYEKINSEAKSDIERMIQLVIFGCVNEDGSPFFDSGDIEFLKEKSAESIGKLFNEVVSLCTMSTKAIEEKAKNS